MSQEDLLGVGFDRSFEMTERGTLLSLLHRLSGCKAVHRVYGQVVFLAWGYGYNVVVGGVVLEVVSIVELLLLLGEDLALSPDWELYQVVS